MKRAFVSCVLAACVFAVCLPAQDNHGAQKSFSVVETGIPEMQAALREGRTTSRELVAQYLIRIAIYDDQLHATLAVNRNALVQAGERDRERASGTVRGPLHGIPI